MRPRNVFASLLLVVTLAGAAGLAPQRAAAQATGRTLTAWPIASRAAGPISAGATAPAPGTVTLGRPEFLPRKGFPEIDGTVANAPSGAAADRQAGRRVVGEDRAPAKGDSAERQAAPAAALTDPEVEGVDVAGSSRKLRKSFEGVNLFQQRYVANGGNQFTVEPPDQGICAGNGYVMETVNNSLRIYKTSGSPATGVLSLNEFYGYPPAINRAANPLVFGPSLTDPSCYYDAETKRWFHVVLTLDQDAATGDLTGLNLIDIAVSKTSNPTGEYRYYSINVSGDSDGSVADVAYIGDYPQIGADDNGFYVTTNTFPFFEAGYTGVFAYAFSKEKLADGSIDTFVSGLVTAADGGQAFTVQPAKMGAGSYVSDNNGTQYMLASLTGFSLYANQIDLYALTNTESLDDDAPEVELNVTRLGTKVYGDPPYFVEQKAGPIPNGELNYGATAPGLINMNDSRMHQLYYAKGLLWASLTTGVIVGGERHAGVTYFIIDPDPNLEDVELKEQDYIAVEGHDLSFPAIAATKSGKAVMTMSLVGDDYFPSTVFARLDKDGLDDGEVYVYGEGAGPQDGFTEYIDEGSRPRWGDYSAAATDGSTIWIATEYIAQSCTNEEYIADFTCGGTRALLGNWSTRIGAVRP